MSKAEFVTSAECASCHAAEHDAWSGSHHDRAMEVASEESVLGDFAASPLVHGGARWEFFTRDGSHWVRASDPGGAPRELRVRYTFGVEPLQQLLVEHEGGRLQALPIAWDSRPAEAGGQRWFALHESPAPEPGDVLHWTGAANRWNSMCAHCHSTNLRKGYDARAARYDTTWSEIDVACEACHGPGSKHVALARDADPDNDAEGFETDLLAEGEARWQMDPARGIARRQPAREEHREVEACAPCHSRRSLLQEGFSSDRYLDHYRPALLEDGLYFADGQIHDEVYVYGSFLQSRMYAAGVSCGDCHEPHSLAPRAEGDALCLRCHAPERFALPEHHHHPEESTGARCVECHMPARTYMGVDARRDHGFRVPRPDRAAEFGVPDACSACHTEGPEWAAQRIESWRGETPAHGAGFASAFAGARSGAPAARSQLRELASRASEPGIVRATALSLLAREGDALAQAGLIEGAQDTDPLVRAAAARGAEALPPEARLPWLAPLLEDEWRSVRIAAARALAEVSDTELRPGPRRARQRALAEYRATQQLHADEPSAHVNLALLALAEGRPEASEHAYRRAIAVGDYFLPAYVNLADLYRAQGRDREGETLLREALRFAPDAAEVRHALGLALVRLGRHPEAIPELARAAALAPEEPRFAFVHAIALHSTGDTERAIQTLVAVHERRPGDRAVLGALASIHRDAGRVEEARAWARRLEALDRDEAEDRLEPQR